MTVRGFISDMDGVIVDTERFWYKSALEIGRRYGGEISRREYEKLIGSNHKDDARFFKEKFRIPNTIEEIIDLRESTFLESIDKGKSVFLNDGYLELLEILKKNDIRISLASTSSMGIINKIMERTSIRKYFSYLVSAEDVESKINAYIEAIKSMNLKPSECFALEDSVNGGLAAKEAELYCVVVPNPFTNNADFSFADEVHKTIKDFLQNGNIIKALEVK